jgi:hypothetical protein
VAEDNIATAGLAGIQQGMQFAQQAEELKQRRMALEEQKKQLAVQRTDFVAGKLRDGLLMPASVQDDYFKTVTQQANTLGVAVDPASLKLLRDPDYKQQALAGLFHIAGLPEDQKSQAGAQLFAYLGGDVKGLSEFLIKSKEAQAKAAQAEAMGQFRGAGLEVRKQGLTDRVVKEVTNYEPLKKQITNITQADAGLALLGNDPKHVLFRDYREVVADIARIVTQGGQAALGREEALEFKSFAVKAQQTVDKFKGKESDYIDPKEAQLVMDRLARLKNKAIASRDTLLTQQLGSRLKSGVISPDQHDAILSQIRQEAGGAVSSAHAGANEGGGAKLPQFTDEETQALKGIGLDPDAPDFLTKYQAFIKKRSAGGR